MREERKNVAYQINLLPWRQRYYRHQLRLFVLHTGLALLCFLSGYVAFSFLSETLTKKQTEYSTHLQQIDDTLQSVSHHVEQLRQRYRVNETSILVNENLLTHVLNALAGLPLEEGELIELRLSEGVLDVQGYVVNQTEFEHVHQFFLNHPLFQKTELTHFQPEPTQISFQFELLIMEQ